MTWNQEVVELLRSQESDHLAFLQTPVRTPSANPAGNTAKAINAVQRYLALRELDCGIIAPEVDKPNLQDPRNNAWRGDCVLNAGPGGMESIGFAEKGTLRISFEAKTEGGHGAYLHRNEGTIRIASYLVDRLTGLEAVRGDGMDLELAAYLRREDVRRVADNVMSAGAADSTIKPTVKIGTIMDRSKVNKIPSAGTFEADIRVPIRLNTEVILASVDDILQDFPEVSCKIQRSASNLAAASSINHPLRDPIQRKARVINGKVPLPVSSLWAPQTPSDLALNPPESYLFVQDGLIVACGVIYALCYVFYMARTYKDKTMSGPVEFLCGTISYEVYYAFTVTSTTFERLAFLVWFLLDIGFATVAIKCAYPADKRKAVSLRMVSGVVVGVAFYHALGLYFPDERQQVTAYWTGLALQFPIGWGAVLRLLNGDAKGQSIEIWLTRYLGCVTAYSVFFWRYLNVPQNWSYVGSPLSIAVIALTMLPETFWPYFYISLQRGSKAKGE
ncbi:hypothetical protein B0A50_05148 [Salinomyces thailandicus]|uniref:Peptidase M20 dimerisation domain-containing protein n=1 Tax=Salinomyces thailandicus TaxID=706561 RepID=A0A4V6WJR3_9PEZI|nr:hypothetical protein B0A50_05148 [Salinomyces thailandica]